MKRAILTGNGLSVALNKEFGLESITKRFFDRLDEEHKSFIEHHMKSNYNQLDFEEAISSVELALDTLKHYNKFLSQEKGKHFMKSYKLDDSNFNAHLEVIQGIVFEYIASVLDLIDGNVKQSEIENQLNDFVNWLTFTIDNSNEIDLFTLNFDLLLETILLTYYNKRDFADFHYRGDRWAPIGNEYRFYFGPDRSKQFHPENYAKNVRLHHLHGSLTSFKDLEDGRLFKVTTEDLRNYEIYNKIFEIGVIPSIVTGGGKSLKVLQEPFSYYYNEFKKKMVIEDYMCDELYIIGYSFRDEHINKAIKERMEAARRKENPKDFKLIIVDFATIDKDKQEFIDTVNFKLQLPKKHRFIFGDERILFGGANDIASLL
ncbi:SIR2 family protein [Oceanobacillus picturae]|uniref:SIR2 family protein n=1 Tax=Oceanobacillus picturae TaxID=171693 RepID=UPI0036260D72